MRPNGLDLAGLLGAVRPVADAMLTDVGKITRPGSGERVFDRDTMTYTDPLPEIVYQGRCRLGEFQGFSGERQVTHAEADMHTVRYELELPWDAPEVLPGDTFTALESEDPLLIGRVFRVRQATYTSAQAERRVILEESA